MSVAANALVAVVAVLAALLAVVLAGLLIGERGRFAQPSTRKVLAEAGRRKLFLLDLLHGYFYARWPRRYIGLFVHRIIPRMSRRAKQWLADHYHGKVLRPAEARAIITVQKAIALRDLEQVIPYPTARQLVLAAPPALALFECPCRHVRRNPCKPTQVCIVVGQPFVDFALEHNRAWTRPASRQEVLDVLEAEHRRGHVHMAWFKDVCLDRMFAICNCCPCCCGGIEAMVRHGVPMIASSGYVARVDPARCAGCGTCEKLCPFSAIRTDGISQVDFDRCMGCGVCCSRCPEGAIRLDREPAKGVPLDVHQLGG